ncbi:MAG: DJ-1/PfpI family protein [Lachnospiraceae bacterium]|nr:DJ-1/PfpI family protein [Lachnospiraceae bacterium]
MKKKIGVLLENRFIDQEIIYYANRFPEAGFEVVFLTRLWGQDELTFKGMELGMSFSVHNSFENITEEQLKEYAAIILPAGYVADFLLYSEKPKEKSPAVLFIEKIMRNKELIKGFICHSLWIAGPSKDTFSGRKVTCHNNIIAHVENAGMIYEDKDICRDDDLITARTGGHFTYLAKAILEAI